MVILNQIKKAKVTGETHAILKGRIPLALGFIFFFSKMNFDSESGVAGAGNTNEYTRLVEAIVAYVLALATIMPHSGKIIGLATRVWPYFLFIAFAASSAAWSKFPFDAVKYAIHCVGLFLIAAATAIACAEDRRRLYSTLHTVALILIVLSVAMVFILPSRGTLVLLDEVNSSHVARWRGVTFHPNMLGAVCVIEVWASLALRIDQPKGKGSIFYGLTTFLALFVTYRGANSMTAFVAELVMVGFYALISMRPIPRLSPVKFFIAGATGVIGLLMMAVSGISGFDLLHRGSSFSGRTELWIAALGLIAMKPLTGWSFDENRSILAYLAGRMPYLEFHNGYLDFAIKGGLISIVFLLYYIYLYARAALKMRSINPVTALTSLMLLFALLTLNLTESSFFVVFETLSFPAICIWIMNEYQLMQKRAPVLRSAAAPRPKVRILTLATPTVEQKPH